MPKKKEQPITMFDSFAVALNHLSVVYGVRFSLMLAPEGWFLTAWSLPDKAGRQSTVATTCDPVLVNAIHEMRTALSAAAEKAAG